MAYKIRPGVELIKICDQNILVATRAQWQECRRPIRPIPKMWAACWALMEKDKTDQDVVETFRELLHRPEDELRVRLNKIFDSLVEDGFLISV